MTIETKYNVGDEVWYKEGRDTFKPSSVRRVNIDTDYDAIVQYALNDTSGYYTEDSLYQSHADGYRSLAFEHEAKMHHYIAEAEKVRTE